MEKMLTAIPVYNLLTNLIPGTLLAILLKFFVEGCDVFSITDNTWILAVILYFMGVINSRISSLMFEPLFKKFKIVKYASYDDYTKAEFKDTSGKLTLLSQANNEYRSYLSVFTLVIIFKLLFLSTIIKEFVTEYISWLVLFLGFLLFLFSYRKQVTYITSRIIQLNK